MGSGVVAVGAHTENGLATLSGKVRLYDASTGAQFLELLAPDGDSIDLFGFSVAIDGDVLLVGAEQDEDNGFASGSAYVFDPVTGAFKFKILAPDGQPDDSFGNSCDVSCGLIVVGARNADTPITGAGAAYVFSAHTGTFVSKLVANFPAFNDQIGDSVAIWEGIAAVGGSERGPGSAGRCVPV